MDQEKASLIRMIRDYAPQIKAAELAQKTFPELADIYKKLRGWGALD